jgi:hypothetical protein
MNLNPNITEHLLDDDCSQNEEDFYAAAAAALLGEVEHGGSVPERVEVRRNR